MGCKSCKKKNPITDQIEKSTDFVERAVVWFFIIWSIFAIYGIICFISKIISLIF